MPDILPDCRASRPIGSVYMGGAWWQPIYCGSCGTPGGLVPENTVTFAYWLCNKCASTWGLAANEMIMPDEVFWEKLKQEQLEAYGRFLTVEELSEVIAADASPLATLIKERR